MKFLFQLLAAQRLMMRLRIARSEIEAAQLRALN
jgi:hypothetical protein